VLFRSERVTNRATLLALNAALEATRSGSEAFASIAEETRRLAEYAREATDTISRLSSEIEMKVGETIGAIQTTSEDAKAAVESMAAGSDAPAPSVAPETMAALETLLHRVRALRERAEAVAAPPARVSGESPGLQSSAPAPAYVTLGTDDTDEVGAGASEPSGAYRPPYAGPPAREGGNLEEAPAPPAVDPPSNAHHSYGDLTFEDSPPPSAETMAPAVESDPLDATTPSGVANDADATSDPADAPDAADAGNAGDAQPPGGTVPGVNVVTKIPDWLEGLEPRDRR